MAHLVAVRIDPDLDEDDLRTPVENPPGLVCYGKDQFVEEGANGEATVDGLPVIGLQAIDRRDSYRPIPGGPIYGECRRAVKRIAGKRRICAFTGVPIDGPALECSCGCVVRADLAGKRETSLCPECRADLSQESPASGEGSGHE